jgi:hypothetical protein
VCRPLRVITNGGATAIDRVSILSGTLIDIRRRWRRSSACVAEEEYGAAACGAAPMANARVSPEPKKTPEGPAVRRTACVAGDGEEWRVSPEKASTFAWN